MAREQGNKIIASNRRARHDYAIEDTIEAGIALTGTEVKSLRAGRASLADGFALVSDGEVWLHNVHIPEYTQGTWTNHMQRTRKLLLHRGEIERLVRKASEQGLTLIPLSLYFKTAKSRWSSHLPAVNGHTIRDRTWPSGMRPGRSSVPGGDDGDSGGGR